MSGRQFCAVVMCCVGATLVGTASARRVPVSAPAVAPQSTCLVDVDADGAVDVATDVVYLARHLLGLPPVPASFRAIDPAIPSDAVIAARIDALCPPAATPTFTPSLTPTPSSSPRPTPTATAGASDCCQCSTFCAVPVNGTCGGCGLVLDAACMNGELCVLHTTTPTLAPTISPTPTVPTPAIVVDVVSAAAGATGVPLTVTLFAHGAQVAGAQNTLIFDNTNVSLALTANGKPDCTVNPGINKDGTSFALQPAHCAGSACTGVKALVLALDNTDPIPDGSVLYTCYVNASAGASGRSTVAITGGVLSDPNGARIAGAVGLPGAVVFPGGPAATPTPSATAATPTPTLTPSPTATKIGTAFNTATPTATLLPSFCTGDCDGSGDVTVDEIILMVNISLGTVDNSACPHGGGQITLAGIITAVENDLNGCLLP